MKNKYLLILLSLLFLILGNLIFLPSKEVRAARWCDRTYSITDDIFDCIDDSLVGFYCRPHSETVTCWEGWCLSYHGPTDCTADSSGCSMSYNFAKCGSECTSDGSCSDCSTEGRSDCGPSGSCSVCQKRTGITTCKDNCGNVCSVTDNCVSDDNCDNGDPANCSHVTAPSCILTGPSSLAVGTNGKYKATATGNGDTVRRIEIWRAQENYLIDGADPRPATGWRLIGSADTNPAGISSTTQTWSVTSSDLTGQFDNKWWVVCNAYYDINGGGTNTTRCTGNPWDDHTLFADCGPSDNMQVQVNQACPGPPTWLNCSSSVSEADDNITLWWGNASNEDGYRIERNGSVIDTVGTDVTTYTDSGAKSCGNYTYLVAAYRAGCPDAWSSSCVHSQGISAPSNVSCWFTQPNSNLNWEDYSSIENQFRVERSTDGGASWSYWQKAEQYTPADRTRIGTHPTVSEDLCSWGTPPATVQYRVQAQRTDLSCYSNWGPGNSCAVSCPTPTPTPTPIPPTPTPTPTPVTGLACNSTCTTDSECASGYYCKQECFFLFLFCWNWCRNLACPEAWDCVCPPACPTWVSATDYFCDNTGVTITWDDNSTNEDGFRIYRDTGLIYTTGPNVTSYKDTSVSCNSVVHQYQVNAYNAGGECAGPSDTGFCYLPTPANPTCYGCTCNQASAPEADTACSVDWSDVTGADHYPLRVDDLGNPWTGECPATNLGDVCLDVGPSNYPFTGKGGHTYNPWVHTVESLCGQWSSGVDCADCTAAYCPLAPTTCSLSAGANGVEAGDNVTVSWPDVAGNDSYEVKRDGAEIVSGLGADATSYADGGATHCGTYSYQVASVKAGCTDKWIACGSVSQVINAPTNLVATRTGCNVGLTWTDNSNIEDSFVIERQLDYGSGYGAWSAFPPLATGSTTYTDSNVFCGATPAASAKYRVKAKNTALVCTSTYSNEAGASCPLDATSTTLTLIPSTTTIVMGETHPLFTYEVVPDCGVFDHIEFSFEPQYFADVSTANPLSFQGVVNVTAKMKEGETIITVKAFLKPGPVLAVTGPVTVNVLTPPAWFQTKDGDVHANQDITSLIPLIATAPKYLSLPGDNGGMPGVVSYGNDYTLGDYGSISETNWQAKTAYNGDRVDFDYLMNRLNVNTGNVLPGTGDTRDIPDASGIYYIENNNLQLTGKKINGGKKIVIFVKGNVVVNKDIEVDQENFFALITSGDLTFSGVPADMTKKAQGFFLANGTLKVETSGGASDQAFEGEGSFIGWGGGVSFKRDLGPGNQNKTPAEFFLFRPDLLINAPKEFLFTPFVFQEVAP